MKHKGIEKYSLCQCLTMMSLTDFNGGQISWWQWLICLWKFVSLTDSVTLDFGKLKQASRPSSSCCFVEHRTTWCEKKTLYNLEQGGKNIARKAYVRCQEMEFETWNVNHIMWSIPIYQEIWSRILFPHPGTLFSLKYWFEASKVTTCLLAWYEAYAGEAAVNTLCLPPFLPHSVGHTPTLTPSDTPLARTLLSMLANVITCVSIVLYIWSFCFVSKLTQQSL